MIIRNAIPTDRNDLYRLGRAFFDTTYYKEFTEFSDENAGQLFDAAMDNGIILVAEDDGEIVGFVGLVIFPFMFNHSKTMASEVLWYVTPTKQAAGIGKGLLAGIEPACRAKGVDFIQMIHLATSPPQAAAMYEAMGFQVREHSYMKVI